jgi:hypothetical protein
MDSYPCLDEDSYSHLDQRARYLQLAYGQTDRALREYERLKTMYNDVCWYNFEVNASRWKRPWLPTDQTSPLCLVTFHERLICRGGTQYEQCKFSPYYAGEVGLAPPLPPKIAAIEVKESLADYEHARLIENDAIDFAPPHGKKYLELCRTTKVPTSLVY